MPQPSDMCASFGGQDGVRIASWDTSESPFDRLFDRATTPQSQFRLVPHTTITAIPCVAKVVQSLSASWFWAHELPLSPKSWLIAPVTSSEYGLPVVVWQTISPFWRGTIVVRARVMVCKRLETACTPGVAVSWKRRVSCDQRLTMNALILCREQCASVC